MLMNDDIVLLLTSNFLTQLTVTVAVCWLK